MLKQKTQLTTLPKNWIYNLMSDIVRVPVTRFRRELRKWLNIAQRVDIIVTKRDVEQFVVVSHDRAEAQRLITNKTMEKTSNEM